MDSLVTHDSSSSHTFELEMRLRRGVAHYVYSEFSCFLRSRQKTRPWL